MQTYKEILEECDDLKCFKDPYILFLRIKQLSATSNKNYLENLCGKKKATLSNDMEALEVAKIAAAKLRASVLDIADVYKYVCKKFILQCHNLILFFIYLKIKYV